MSANDFSNRISPNIPPQDDQAIDGFLTGLETTLASHCVDLGAEDPRTLSRMGDGSFVFVSLALECAQKYPQICPGFLDVAEFARDVAGANYFGGVERRLQAVQALVHGSNLLCRAEAYQAALAIYGAAKSAAKLGVAGAQAVVDLLSPQFETRANRTRQLPAGGTTEN